MINSQEIKKGTCIRMDGGIWKCIWFEHRKPGKGNTVMNTKLKNVADGRVLDRTFQVGFKLDDDARFGFRFRRLRAGDSGVRRRLRGQDEPDQRIKTNKKRTKKEYCDERLSSR